MCIEQGVDSGVVPNEYQGVVTSNSHFYRWRLPLKQAAWTRLIVCFVLHLLLSEELTETYV